MLSIIRPRACKKCGGDLSLECDIYGVYIQCIQCGANWNEKEIALNARAAEKMFNIVKARPAPAASRPQGTGTAAGEARQRESSPSMSKP